MLEDKLNTELKSALKDHNPVKVSVIRMLKSDITHTAIKLKKDYLSDEEVLKVIQKHIKQHSDSIEQFQKGSRLDLVKKEESELAILRTYVPRQLPDEELELIIKSVIKENGASTIKDMGKTIKTVLDKTGARADGKKISQIVRNLLSG